MDLELIDLIYSVIQVQAELGPTCTGHGTPGVDSRCYASAFTAVGAAFSTMGYWVQSDLLDQMIYRGMALWAPFLYIISAIGGIVSMALGQPPRLYLWFFMGPAIFSWLLDTRTEVTGVAWRVADRYQDQSEVWKLAEVGLINTNIFDRIVNHFGTGVASQVLSANRAPQLPSGVDLNFTNAGGKNTRTSMVAVAMPFLWFDALVSDTIQNMVKWTGIYNQRDYAYTPGDTSRGPGAIRTNINQSGNPALADNKWFLLSNLKWTYLDDITGAKLANPMMRDAFVTFMASECGDMLKKSVHAPAFTAAAHTKGYGVPTSIFRTPNDAFFNYRLVKSNLRGKAIPIPETLKDVLSEKNGNSFRKAVTSTNWNLAHSAKNAGKKPYWFPRDTLEAILVSNRIRCDTYIDLLVLFFRWEASNIYQMTFVNSSGTGGMTDKQLVFNLLYGWDIKKNRSRATFQTLANGPNPGHYLVVGNGDPLTIDEQVNFVQNLILIHLFRNELSVAPSVIDVRYSMSDQAINYVQAYQRTIGSKNKYGEIYTWALMIPYLQGILLYLLAIGYPFACVMMVMPGMHKVIFTWMSFWAWVKLWDLGFAIVMSLERSVWAMIGNKSQITSIFDRIVELDLFGRNVEATIAPGNCSAVPVSMGGCLNRFYNVVDPDGAKYVIGSGTKLFNVAIPAAPTASNPFPNATENYTLDLMDTNLRFLDLGMTLGASLDLDLANGYYIYIMAALYMAVPAVTGQLVLGAKAGAASMVGTAIGGTAQESGRQAGTGYTGDVIQRMKSNSSSIGQAATAKSHREYGLAAQAIGMGNASARAAMKGGYFDQVRSGHANLASIAGNNRLENDANLGFAADTVNAITGVLGGGGRKSPDNTSIDPKDKATNSNNSSSNSSVPGFLKRMSKAVGGVPEEVLKGLSKGMSDGSIVKAIQSAGTAGNFRRYGEQAALHTAGQANAGIAGFKVGQESKGYGEHGSRLSAAANHRAGMDKWKAMSQFANQMSGTSAALGLFAGGLDPGPKPEEATGMAMNGMLGSGTRNMANFFDPSRADGFFGVVSGQSSKLESRYGGASMIQARQSGVQEPFDAFRSALSAAAHQMEKLGDVGPVSDGSTKGK